MDGFPKYQLGNYSLSDHLGGGTFGVVYRAHEQDGDTDLALKVLRPGLSRINPDEVEKFRNEAKRHDDLDNHVNIARFESLLTIPCERVSESVLRFIDLSIPESIARGLVSDEPMKGLTGLRCTKSVPHYISDCTEGEFSVGPSDFLVLVRMKYYPDGDLRTRLQRPVSHEDAIKLGIGIARGLTHMHARGLVHRDLKPSNILIDSRPSTIEDSPKITDFGIARTMSLGDSTYAAGTNGWAAPEQFQSDHSDEIPPTLDIYALGQVLFRMLTGEAPFYQDGRRKPDRVGEKDSTIPGQIALIVDRCREFDPLDRYQTVAEVLEALELGAKGDPRSRLSRGQQVPLRGSPVLESPYDDVSRILGGVLTTNLADRIRHFVNENYIEPAIEQGLDSVEVRAGDVAAAMQLRNRMPSVCNAMTGRKIEDLAGVIVGNIRGPNPGANCYVDYRITDDNANQELDPDSDNPSLVSLDPVPDADLFYNLGLQALNRSNYQGAIESFTYAINENPQHSDAFNNRGVAYYELGDYQAALDDYNEAIRIRGDHPVSYYNRGLVRYQMDDIEGAISDYGRSIDLDPSDPDVFNGRGIAWLESGDYDAAASDFNAALDLDPNHSDALDNLQLIQDRLDVVELEEHWRGPMELLGRLYTEHGDVIRYRFAYEDRRFDLYIPKLLIEASDDWHKEVIPETLVVVLSGGDSDPPSPDRPDETTQRWRYGWYKEHGASIQYRIYAPNYPGTRDALYSIYIPKTIFGDQDPPTNIWLSIDASHPSLT